MKNFLFFFTIALVLACGKQGPNGNAFVLLNLAQKLAWRLGYDKDHIERILDEMRLTDYEGLLHTFDREFGDFVILWR